MDSGKLGGWLQVGANVGILVGLVMVALQMEQNTRMLELQLQKQETDSYISSSLSLVGENFAEVWEKHLEAPETLTLAEMRTMEGPLWSNSIYRWWRTYQLYEEGLVDADVWQATINTDVGYYLGNTYSRAWWNDVKTLPDLPPELVSYVDAQLAKNTDETRDFYRRIQSAIAKQQATQSQAPDQ